MGINKDSQKGMGIKSWKDFLLQVNLREYLIRTLRMGHNNDWRVILEIFILNKISTLSVDLYKIAGAWQMLRAIGYSFCTETRTAELVSSSMIFCKQAVPYKVGS